MKKKRKMKKSNGLTAKQKKLPPALQRAILAKKKIPEFFTLVIYL